MENESKHNSENLNSEEQAYYTGTANLAPIPMSVSSPPIKPIDKGLVKAQAHETMHHQARQQIDMLRKQAELIMQQVREIEARVAVSERIYKSDIRFIPVIGQIYYLYEKENEEVILSMIAPNEWGRSKPFKAYIAKVKLLADKTWDVLEQEKAFSEKAEHDE